MAKLDSLRKNLGFLLFNILFVGIVIAIGEVCSVYMLNNPESIPGIIRDSFRSYYRSQDRNIVQVTDCGRYDEDLFYTLNPGTCSFNNREFTTELSINAGGVRDDENSMNNPQVAVLGDSFSMGWGVAQEESYPQQLEQILQVSVLNLGISSYGTARELILANRLLENLPETIILQYHPSDFEENLGFMENGKKLKISSSGTYDSLRSYIENRTDYFPGKHLSQLVKEYLLGLRKQKEEVDVKKEVNAFIAVLESASVAYDSTQLIVFEIEHHSTLNTDFIDELAQQIQQSDYRPFIENMKIISLTNHMSEGDFFILDDHINKSGHERIASVLAQHLNNETE